MDYLQFIYNAGHDVKNVKAVIFLSCVLCILHDMVKLLDK